MATVSKSQQAEMMCREWQQRLRLRDWDVTVEVARQHHEALRGGSVGACKSDPTAMEAHIVLLDPVDIDSVDPAYPSCRDQERVLVHELLHMMIPCPPRGEDGNIESEKAITMVADALVRLSRGTERP